MEGISGISGKTSPEAPGFEPLLMASFLSYRMRSKWGWWIGISALIIFLCFVIFNLIVIPLLDDNDVQGTIPQDKCHWTPKDPLFFNIHTKLGVNYDAGHWFHMAENIMTYHSVLRSKGQLANASNVIFNFDHADFPLQLNGMTRFITYLGIVSPIAHVESLRYSFDERLLSAKKIGDTFLLDNHRHRPLLEVVTNC